MIAASGDTWKNDPANLIDSKSNTLFILEGRGPELLVWVQLELSESSLVRKIEIEAPNKLILGIAGFMIVRIGEQKVNNESSINAQQEAISKNEICNSYGENWRYPGGIPFGYTSWRYPITLTCERPIVGRFVLIQCIKCEANMIFAEVAVYRNFANSCKYSYKFRNLHKN